MKNNISKLALVVGALALAGSTGAVAQSLKDVREPTTPLVLESRGSFFIGGESVALTPTQLSSFLDSPPTEGGNITVNQMYVEFMVPAQKSGPPVVMLHGSTVTGKSYDTTPDGRMGWYEYFVRQGHPVYVPDQVGRARSGANLATYNDVRAGVADPSKMGKTWRFADQLAWTNFRFGPTVGTPYPDSQFPVAAVEQFSKQAVPDLAGTLPQPDPNVGAMAQLGADLNGAVLMGHSQTGNLPLQVALQRPEAAKGLILVEPGLCFSAQLTNENISTLAKIPILVVFGDHLDQTTGVPGFSWQNAYDDCKAFIARVKAGGGNAQMLYPPDLGIKGNSHMIMQDKNNLQIADLVLNWIKGNIAQ
ncbi:hypothetical protein [Rhizobium lusitanum]|uniref:hypothetical protein n=1 Tax=Rhizobium lusitanum TaxID=293958 RepID=UPI0015717081|nr:hypothetical protein [Rhizobium lusitanum]NTJ11530.1 hypothetical protein [Rhizobium lusitanum]